MAIAFSKPISTTALLNAYNNNVVEFSSDNVLDSTKCTINLGGFDFVITPINNLFRFNYKELLRVLINTNNFTDDILPSLILADETSHVYNDTVNTYLSELVTYTITFSDTSTEQTTNTYKFLKSIEQLEQNKVGVVTGGNGIYILSPFLKATANKYTITYFEGYPFDLSVYVETPGVVTVLNQTNALSHDFAFDNIINRFFLSDGRTTITINDFVPLVDGLNELKLTIGADVIYIDVWKVPSIEGQYVKWQNQYGGWNYWLFNCYHERARKDKDLKTVSNDFNDVSDTTVPIYEMGKTSVDTLTLIADSVGENDQEVLNGILDSPRVYLFTNTRLTQVTDVSWLGVKKKATNTIITDYKSSLKNYKIKIELPPRYTMTL